MKPGLQFPQPSRQTGDVRRRGWQCFYGLYGNHYFTFLRASAFTSSEQRLLQTEEALAAAFVLRFVSAPRPELLTRALKESN